MDQSSSGVVGAAAAAAPTVIGSPSKHDNGAHPFETSPSAPQARCAARGAWAAAPWPDAAAATSRESADAESDAPAAADDGAASSTPTGFDGLLAAAADPPPPAGSRRADDAKAAAFFQKTSADDEQKRLLADREARAGNVTSFVVSEDPPRPRPARESLPENAVEDEADDDGDEAPPDSELCDDLCEPWLLDHTDNSSFAPHDSHGLIDLVPEEPLDLRGMAATPGACCLLGTIDLAALVVDGRWAMTRDQHADAAQTSRFQYASRAMASAPLPPSASAAAVAAHLSGVYTGHFFLQVPGKSQPAKVDEKAMTLDFLPHTRGGLNVKGDGRNRYGPFAIEGVVDRDGTNLEMYRVYVPKQEAPRAERPASASRDRRPEARPAEAAPPPRKPSGKDLMRVQAALAQAGSAPQAAAQPGNSSRSHKRKNPAAPAPARSQQAAMQLQQQQAAAAAAASLAAADSRGSGRVRKAPSHLRDLAGGGVLRANAATAHLSEPLRRCHAIVLGLERAAGAHWFAAPVDAVKLGVPHYHAVVATPMDLQTLRAGVERGAYPDVSAFAADARRIFRNAMTFNVLPDSAPHMAARDVHERLEAELTALDTAWAEAKRPRTMKGGQPKREAASHYADDDYEYYDAAGGPSAKKKAKSGKGKKGPGIADRAPLRSSSDMVPVTQLVDMQRQMELMHQTILALQRQASQTDMQVQMNMEAGLGPGGAAPASTAALARAKASKPLTFEEKAQLSDDINSLPAEKLGSVIKIVQEHMPLVSRAGAADDEIEVDIETLDNETLRHLQRYVKTALAPKARQPRASPKPGDGTAKKGRAKSPPPAYATPAAPKAPPHDAYPNLGAGFDDEEDDDDLAYDVLGD